MANEDDLTFNDELLDTAFSSMGDWQNADYEGKDFGLSDVIDAFWDGFVDPNATDAFGARADFFEYAEEMGYDLDDFDWEAWREYMYG